MTHTDRVATMAAADRRAELEAELPLIVERLVRLGASRILLFGSLARGEVGPTSDIDLLVVLDRPGRFADRLTAVYDAMRSRVGVDALVLTPAELDELARTRAFIHDIIATGRVLHAS